MLMSVKSKVIGTRFQREDRFVRIPGFDRNEPCFLDDFDHKHPQLGFIPRRQERLEGVCRVVCCSMNRTLIGTDVVRRIRFAGPKLRHPKAMRLQIRIEGIFGKLLEVRGQAQALKLESVIIFQIRHGAPPTNEASSRTPMLCLSVVQTTEPNLRAQDCLDIER